MSYQFTTPQSQGAIEKAAPSLVMFGMAALGIWWFVGRAKKGYRKNPRRAKSARNRKRPGISPQLLRDRAIRAKERRGSRLTKAERKQLQAYTRKIASWETVPYKRSRPERRGTF